jgi:2-polyprenyl-6-methoxyphenol hydroxylase-like FAD-dependent oxidoreductase
VHDGVLIIGAGIAGLTLAARLQHAGLKTEVAEQAGSLRVAGCGVMLHPNALLCLTHLGAELADRGTFISEQLITDPDGSHAVVRWDEVWDGRLPLAIHRRRLAGVLLAQLTPGTVRWGTRPGILWQDAKGVSVRLGEREIHRYSLVIGADGIHSTTRQLIVPGSQPQPLGQMFWRSTAHARPPFDFAEWRVWRGGSRFFGAMPVGQDRIHVFLQSTPDDPVARGTTTDAGADMLRLAGSVSAAAAVLTPKLIFDGTVDVRAAYQIMVPRWTAGRIGILGDAAHAVSPATTQGAALAIEDAAVLAEEMGRLGPQPAALSAFEARRRPRVAAFIRLARLHAALMGGMHSGGDLPPPGIAKRDSTRWFRRLYAPLADAG